MTITILTIAFRRPSCYTYRMREHYTQSVSRIVSLELFWLYFQIETGDMTPSHHSSCFDWRVIK